MKSDNNRLHSIDALRGLAAITIVLYHARSMLWIGVKEAWQKYGLSLNINAWLGYLTVPLYFGGFAAIGLFFILSGYCIHRQGALKLSRNPNAPFNFKQFALRRLWRIYPTYIAALFITAVIDAYLNTYHPTQTTGQDNSVFGFFMSLLSLQGLAAPTFGSNAVFWTLALELHFYVVYPLLYYISRKYGALQATGLTLVTSLIYLIADMLLGITQIFPNRFHGGGPIFLPYWFTWGFGFYLAEVEAGRAFMPKNLKIFVALSTILTIPTMNAQPLALKYFTSTLIFGAILWWSIISGEESFWRRFPGKILAKIGIFSYSIYAIHVPCLLMYKAIITHSSTENFVTILPVFIGCIISLCAGGFLFLTVERHSFKYLKKVKVIS